MYLGALQKGDQAAGCPNDHVCAPLQLLCLNRQQRHCQAELTTDWNACALISKYVTTGDCKCRRVRRYILLVTELNECGNMQKSKHIVGVYWHAAWPEDKKSSISCAQM